MKLLSRTSANDKIQKDNQDLIETNIRLRKFWQEITQRLNGARENYEPDKLAALREFEAFTKDLLAKKSTLLQELSAIEKAIKEKKELYYALIEKQDALDEKLHQMNEQESKLKLREAFVVDLEQKWRAKNQ